MSTNNKHFEFCVVCKLNHNQGRRHNFLPNHKKSLSALLSRFQSKLSDIRFFLRNPIPLRPEHASLNRLWCLFCECDILELDSFYASDNTIRHLASADHMKKVKGFLYKYGGGMDKVDTFRITEADFAKWEKKCNLLKKGALDGGSRATSIGPSNGMRDRRYLKTECVVLQMALICIIRAWAGNSVKMVVPPMVSQVILWTFCTDAQKCLGFHATTTSHQYLNDGSVNPDGRMTKDIKSSLGPPNITQISITFQEDSFGNVHCGAPPPWFNETEKSQLDFVSNTGRSDLSPPHQKKKSKLNPNRVGAAWAERRKVELELKGKGEPVTNNFDVNWLPNFGRVWQSGTRKESRKEFQLENHKSAKVESQSQSMVQLQPYVSKWKRKDHVDDELD